MKNSILQTEAKSSFSSVLGRMDGARSIAPRGECVPTGGAMLRAPVRGELSELVGRVTLCAPVSVAPRFVALLFLFLLALTSRVYAGAVDESFLYDFDFDPQTIQGNPEEICFGTNGEIYVVGTCNSVNGDITGSVLRILPDGSVDKEYPKDMKYDRWMWACALQPDGKLIVGAGETGDRVTPPLLNRLNPDGSLDESFDVGHGPLNLDFRTYLSQILVAGADEIYVTGSFNWWNFNENIHCIARLHGDGSLDPDFTPEILLSPPAPNYNESVYAIARYPDGRLLIAGRFNSVNGEPFNNIARLNADGSNDETFQPGAGPNSENWFSLALQPDGKALVLGSFDSYDGTPCDGVVRLNVDGSVDSSFSLSITNIADGVYTTNSSTGIPTDMAVDSYGRLVIIGFFNEVNGIHRQGVVRLLADGTVDPDFDPGIAFVNLTNDTFGYVSTPYKVWIDSEDRVVIGGILYLPDKSPTGLLRFNATPPRPPVIENLGLSAETGNWLQVTNPTRSSLVLQCTTNFTDWTVISTNHDHTPIVEFHQPPNSDASGGFYRVAIQP